jgi:antitoxin CptB
MPETAQDSRLHWRCRRGMLELDLILLEFLAKGYNSIDARQKHLLDAMLEYPDQLLLDLLLGNMLSSDKEIAHFVAHLRHTIRA